MKSGPDVLADLDGGRGGGGKFATDVLWNQMWNCKVVNDALQHRQNHPANSI